MASPRFKRAHVELDDDERQRARSMKVSVERKLSELNALLDVDVPLQGDALTNMTTLAKKLCKDASATIDTGAKTITTSVTGTAKFFRVSGSAGKLTAVVSNGKIQIKY